MEEEEEEVEERWRAIEGSYTLPAAVLLSAVHALEQWGALCNEQKHTHTHTHCTVKPPTVHTKGRFLVGQWSCRLFIRRWNKQGERLRVVKRMVDGIQIQLFSYIDILKKTHICSDYGIYIQFCARKSIMRWTRWCQMTCKKQFPENRIVVLLERLKR